MNNFVLHVEDKIFASSVQQQKHC
uniref:Uncharacterized protein n=1 Tax=Lepeophtheirus salmonis TaxID=72036 RepID=A0A0K2TK24_LEPSM